MNKKAIMIAGIAGTSVMTTFSYLLSSAKDKNFKEPLLLGLLLQRLSPSLQNRPPSRIAGWSLHYITGIAFAAVYIYLLEKLKQKPSFLSAVIYSAVCAVIAVLIWKFCFRAHPNPPRIHYRQYYRQLMVAHFFFGISMYSGYSLLHNKI